MGQKEQASSFINRRTLRLIREGFAESEMTQVELADASGIPRSSLANMLSPTAAPRLVHVEQLIRIAIAMGIDPRVWVGELERLERERTGQQGGELARRRTGGSRPPQVQKRAARSRTPRDPA